MVDSVLYRWQLELEKAGASQALNLVDFFAAAWTPDSLHAAALLQRAQIGVAAGCTGLSQVTDIGFASQAKAALARWSEDVKQAMRLKARRQGVQCQYRTQCSDILKAAKTMQGRHAPACVRPALGCRPAGRQCQDGLRPSARQRVLWAQAGEVQPFTDAQKQDSELAEALQLEASYLISQSTDEIAGFSLTDFLVGVTVLPQTEKELVQRAEEALPRQPEADPQGGSPAADDQPSQEKEDQTEQQVRCQAGSGRLAEGERQTIS